MGGKVKALLRYVRKTRLGRDEDCLSGLSGVNIREEETLQSRAAQPPMGQCGPSLPAKVHSTPPALNPATCRHCPLWPGKSGDAHTPEQSLEAIILPSSGQLEPPPFVHLLFEDSAQNSGYPTPLGRHNAIFQRGSE